MNICMIVDYALRFTYHYYCSPPFLVPLCLLWSLSTNEVFPVELAYNETNGMIAQKGVTMLPWQLEPDVRVKLLEWAERYRWPFFLRQV